MGFVIYILLMGTLTFVFAGCWMRRHSWSGTATAGMFRDPYLWAFLVSLILLVIPLLRLL